MPMIQCDIREGRTEEQKRALARETTRVVHETIDALIEYIYVLIRETPGFNHIKAGHHLPDWTPPASDVVSAGSQESESTPPSPDQTSAPHT